MNSKMAMILTTRVSCVHEQYHLIHFRHLQIYCNFPTTSAKNLDVGLQVAVPSYDAQYFVYERVAKQRIIIREESELRNHTRILIPHCRTDIHKYILVNLINQCSDIWPSRLSRAQFVVGA